MYNKTILAVLMRYDYGKPERGDSGDKLWFYNNLVKLTGKVEVLWYDDYLQNLPLLQQLLFDKVKKINPDLIFFLPFQEQFTFETLDLLKRSHTTVAWFGDDTWRFDSFSSRYAPHYSYVATTDLFSVPKYKKIGAVPILLNGRQNFIRNELVLLMKVKHMNLMCLLSAATIDTGLG